MEDDKSVVEQLGDDDSFTSSEGRNDVVEFLRNAYEMVDNPETDKAIAWGPNGDCFVVLNPKECCRELFPRILGTHSFERFELYGFTKNESGEYLEFASDDFVKGRPDLLQRISERVEAKGLEFAYHEPCLVQILKCKDLEMKHELLIDFKEQMRKGREAALLEEMRVLVKRISLQRKEKGSVLKDAELKLKQIVLSL